MTYDPIDTNDDGVVDADVDNQSVSTERADIADGWASSFGPTIPPQKVTDDSDYNSEPKLRRLSGHNDDYVLIYRVGSYHVDNSGKLVCRRGGNLSDLATANEITIVDDPSFDDRNQSVVYIPDADRLVVFYRVFDSNEVTTQDTAYVESLDGGQTWSNGTSVSSTLTMSSGPTPYGGGVETSNGWMTLFYDGEDRVEALFSTDDGQTWGSPSVIIDESATSKKAVEPIAVGVDDSPPHNRLILYMRAASGYIAATSSDGGSTWSSTTSKFSPNVLQTADDPIYVDKTGENRLTAIFADDTNFRIYATEVSAEAAFADPSVIQFASQIDVAHGSGTSTTADFGYPTFEALGPHGENLVATWYDDDGSGTPNIYLGSVGSEIGGTRVMDGAAVTNKPLVLREGDPDNSLRLGITDGDPKQVLWRTASNDLRIADLSQTRAFGAVRSGSRAIYDDSGAERLRVADYGVDIRDGPLYEGTGGVVKDPTDLTATTGASDWQVLVHDGSGTPPEGLYRWDDASSEWMGIDPNTSGTTI